MAIWAMMQILLTEMLIMGVWLGAKPTLCLGGYSTIHGSHISGTTNEEMINF